MFVTLKLILFIGLLNVFTAVCGQLLDNRLNVIKGVKDLLGGEKSSTYYPYMVSIEKPTSYAPSHWEHLCSGSILSKCFVLTTADCLRNYNNRSTLQIKAGIRNLDEPGDIHTFQYFVIHERYNTNTYENDIAIMKMNNGFKFNEQIQPIRYTEERIETHENSVLTGWPLTTSWSKSRSKDLKSINFTIIDNRQCSFLNPKIFDSTICARSNFFNVGCFSDSGAPLVRISDSVLIGIIPLQKYNCYAGRSTAFTRVSAFYHWIEDHINN